MVDETHEIPVIDLRPPYLLFTGTETDPSYAKTGFGVVQWRREQCLGQLRLSADGVDLGLPDLSVEAAVERGVKSLLIGTATIGGTIPPSWMETLLAAARAGLNIVAGPHQKLNAMPALAAAAREAGVSLIDVRVPPDNLPVGTGRKRTGLRLLTVGTDCALGKKYTALQLEADMRRRGAKVDFRASGQTGIMIAGRGLPIDAVVSDFLSGAAEVLSPDNEPDHWDIVEGQGAIFHPGYAAVSHGLLIGSQPDALVVCHHAGRTHVGGWPGFALPSISEVITRNIEIGKLTNPDVSCVGIAINTAHLSAAEAHDYLARLADTHGLPTVDPIRTGTDAIIDQLERQFGAVERAS